MYSHDGTWDFLKLASILFFICIAVWWLQSAIGTDYTVLVIFALVGVLIFAAGAMFAHVNQKTTLDAITKFNANDAQIDKYRMQTMREASKGEAAMQKAAAALTVLDAKRVNQIAGQQAKLLTDTERAKWEAQRRQQLPITTDDWSWDDDSNDSKSFQNWG